MSNLVKVQKGGDKINMCTLFDRKIKNTTRAILKIQKLFLSIF